MKKLTSEGFNKILEKYTHLEKIYENEYEFGCEYGTLFKITKLEKTKNSSNLYVVQPQEHLHAIVIDALYKIVYRFNKYDVEEHKVNILREFAKVLFNRIRNIMQNLVVREEYIDYLVHNFMMKDFCEIEKYENLSNAVNNDYELKFDSSSLGYTSLTEVHLSSNYKKLANLEKFYNEAQSFIGELRNYDNCVFLNINEEDFDLSVSFDDFIISKGIVFEPKCSDAYRVIPDLERALSLDSIDYTVFSNINPLSPDEIFKKCLDEGFSSEELLYGNSRDMFEYLIKSKCGKCENGESHKYTDEDFDEYVKSKHQYTEGIQYKK